MDVILGTLPSLKPSPDAILFQPVAKRNGLALVSDQHRLQPPWDLLGVWLRHHYLCVCKTTGCFIWWVHYTCISRVNLIRISMRADITSNFNYIVRVLNITQCVNHNLKEKIVWSSVHHINTLFDWYSPKAFTYIFFTMYLIWNKNSTSM